MAAKLQLAGQVFGKLTAVKALERRGRSGEVYWLCQCACGQQHEVIARALKSGHTGSCGCYWAEKMSDISRLLPDGVAAFNALYRGYERAAKKRGLDFLLTKVEFENLTRGNCRYCGITPSRRFDHGDERTKKSPYVCNGIDRVDNEHGYTSDNTVPCCKTCNIAKRAMTLADFMSWIDRLVQVNSRRRTD